MAGGEVRRTRRLEVTGKKSAKPTFVGLGKAEAGFSPTKVGLSALVGADLSAVSLRNASLSSGFKPSQVIGQYVPTRMPDCMVRT